MAPAGHSTGHKSQSMQSSGLITKKFGPSKNASAGHTATQSVYLHFIQLSVTTNAMTNPLSINGAIIPYITLNSVVIFSGIIIFY